MVNYAKKIIAPHSILIEKTAGEMAAVWYEAARSSGLKFKWKNPRAFAKANLEKFIPAAVQCLIQMLANPSIHQDQKDLIHQAILERVNDPDTNMDITHPTSNVQH